MTVTFTGEKCSYDGPQQVTAGEIVVDWIVDNEDHDRYGLAVVTLDEGKTFADLDAWPSTDQPPWLQLVDFADVGPGSRLLMVADVEQGPIYFVCFTAYPETKMGTLGPVEVGE